MLDIYLLISEWMRLLASRTLEVEREIDAIEIVKSSANLHHKANIIWIINWISLHNGRKDRLCHTNRFQLFLCANTYKRHLLVHNEYML